ncbi:MAG: conjugal transfer protein TraD [Novosphingobium sp.]|jgi:hypothetical protein|nr:conjugal transfer protein TraD [Novosphingobium sp.]
MHATRDYDAELKALADKARQLKERRVRQLGELVIATGAKTLSAEELAGALVVIAETTEAGKKEAWAKRGAGFFRSRARTRPRSANGGAGDAANDDPAQSPASGARTA